MIEEKTEFEHLKLSAIVKNIPVGLITASPDGTIEEYNDAFLTSINLKSIENIRTLQELHETVLKKERNEYSSITQKLISADKWTEVTVSLNTGGTEKKYNLQKKIIFREETPFFMIFSIQEMTKMARDNELTAWREISRKLAHEIKNPLLPIQISAERLRLQSGNPQKLADILPESVNMILSSVDMINKLVSDFSKFAKLTGIKKEPLDIEALLDEVIKNFASFSGVKFELKYDEKMIIPGDRPRLKDVFYNLIKNSIEALEQKGEIRIEIKEEHGFAVIHFYDNGPGLPETTLSNLFKPYFTTKTEGTGLGLTIVYRIIELHKGKIEFDNTGGGAHFIIRLPTGGF